LDQGQANPVLTLKIVKNQSQTGTKPIILACQAGSAWQASSAPQAWKTHPKPDCTKSVQGQITPDGSAIVFPVGPLQFNDQLNVILVPGIDPSLPAPANSSQFTLVFQPPTQADVVTSAGPPPPPPAPPAPTSFNPAPGGAPETSAGSFTAPATSKFTPPAAALPPTQQGQTATAPILDAATSPVIPVRAADAKDNNNSRLMAILVLLAGAAVAFWSYRTSSAGAFGRRGPETEQIGGLGRFARAREGIAPRLG
jgi:hypothetical protein